jgi:cell division inhibitor SepF
MLKKTLIYLGLGPDEEYEHYDEFAPAGAAPTHADRPAETASVERPVMRAVPEPASRPQSNTVRAIPRPQASHPSGSVRVIQPNPGSRPGADAESSAERSPARPQDAVSAVRIVDADTAKPHAMSPTSFNDAQSIGDRFKKGQAVIVNLQGVDRDLRRRLVDFASGLCYALGGKMDKVASQVYLLTPTDVVVSASDTRRALS